MKQCKCGATRSDAHPRHCVLCSTFTHSAYGEPKPVARGDAYRLASTIAKALNLPPWGDEAVRIFNLLVGEHG